jgi:hypothetical protein
MAIEPFHDLVARQPFRKGNGVQDRFALDQRIEHFPHAGVLLDRIFARLQFRLRLEVNDDASHEDALISDDPVALQAAGDLAYPFALRDHHDGGVA